MQSIPKTYLIAMAALTAGVLLSNVGKAQVLAHLGEEPITQSDVDFQLGRRPGTQGAALPPALANSTIDLIAAQRRALASLRKMKIAVSRAAVDRWLEQNPPPTNNPEYKLSADEIVTAICKETQLTQDTYRDLIAFRLSWPIYLKKLLTDANVEKHFGKQTARFDGTEFEIEMASIATSAGESEQRQFSESKLAKLKEQLEPEADNFGDLAKADREIEFFERRWVRGTGDLDPRLLDTIITLQKDDISAPVHSASGVHLIRLIDMKPGNRGLSEARDEVRGHMLIFLLDHLADKSAASLPLKSNQ